MYTCKMPKYEVKEISRKKKKMVQESIEPGSPAYHERVDAMYYQRLC